MEWLKPSEANNQLKKHIKGANNLALLIQLDFKRLFKRYFCH